VKKDHLNTATNWGGENFSGGGGAEPLIIKKKEENKAGAAGGFGKVLCYLGKTLLLGGRGKACVCKKRGKIPLAPKGEKISNLKPSCGRGSKDFEKKGARSTRAPRTRIPQQQSLNSRALSRKKMPVLGSTIGSLIFLRDLRKKGEAPALGGEKKKVARKKLRESLLSLRTGKKGTHSIIGRV